MTAWLAQVQVALKPSVNDPQGLSIKGALRALGFATVEDVRAGKLLRVRLEAEDHESAHAAVTRMCEQLLANPVIETYSFDLVPAADPALQQG